MTNVLSVRGLRKTFGGVVALDDVSFELAQGELLAMIGPNGAGKSTCFNIVGGQLLPDAGSVKLFEREIVGATPRKIWRYGVGRTFQITATFASMTVLENIQVALISARRRLFNLLSRACDLFANDALAILNQVGMSDQAGTTAGHLAYGDLKRVELAIALANAPKVLLMDEPTAGMAPSERAALMRLIADIVRERGISVLFTEHDMDVVFNNANRILVLDHGRLLAAGTPSDVRADGRVQDVYLGTGPRSDENVDWCL